MELTYSVGGVKVWDAQTHQYTVTEATSGWSENGNIVKVTNHSNVAVSATLGFTADVVDVVVPSPKPAARKMTAFLSLPRQWAQRMKALPPLPQTSASAVRQSTQTKPSAPSP